MNEGPIFLEGVNLMLLGMGFVFSFLVLLVGPTRLLSSISIKLSPPAKSVSTPKYTTSQQASSDNVVAAISAALHHHNQKMNKQVQA